MDTGTVKYRSRKFLITLTTLIATTALAYSSKMSSDVALVFAACVAAYNWANVKKA